MSALLEIRDLDVAYGQTQVVFGADIDVAEGEILALLGTNGAGKSTVLRAVSGLARVTGGSITFDGSDITGAKAAEVAALGIGQVPGGRGVFPSLTVQENLRVAGWGLRRDRARLAAATDEMLSRFPRLAERLDTRAGALSGGEQQMLSLAQAFLNRPRLLLVDELSLGLAVVIVDDLLDFVRSIRDQGTTVVVVEQSVTTALRIADRAVFLEKGEVRFSGPTEELTQRKDLLRAVYLRGTAGAHGAPGPPGEVDPDPGPDAGPDGGTERSGGGPVVLRVEGLRKRFGGIVATDDVSFAVADGEILGLLGPNGAGKTTIFDLVSGFLPLDEGSVHLLGEDVTDRPPHERARLGLGRMFQDARLWASMTVHEAITTALERHHPAPETLPAALGLSRSRLAEAELAARADELVELVGVGAFRDKFIHELSTGSRRFVELATLVAARPRVLLLDEPSSGIAQREAEALGPVLRAVQTHLGASILIIEHSMPLLTALADRLVALEAGAKVTEGSIDDVLSHPRVIRSYLGEREGEGEAA